MKVIKKVLKKKRGRPSIPKKDHKLTTTIRLKVNDRKKLEKRYGSVQRAIDYLVTTL